MTEPEFRTLQRRARRQERARQWPALDLRFVVVLLLLTVVYVIALATAPLWWWP